MSDNPTERDKVVLRVIAGWDFAHRPSSKDYKQVIRKRLAARAAGRPANKYELTETGEQAIGAKPYYTIFESGTFKAWSETFEGRAEAEQALQSGNHTRHNGDEDVHFSSIVKRYEEASEPKSKPKKRWATKQTTHSHAEPGVVEPKP